MIRDRLVVGIRDSPLSERLQLDPDLTLEKAKKMIRQREAVHEQQEVLRGTGEATSTLEEIRSGQRYPSKRRWKKGQIPKQQNKCSRCGKGQHSRDKCPAKDAKCHKCKKNGHYEALCFTKSVSEVTEGGLLDTAFLGTVTSNSQTSWIADLEMCGKTTKFKLDTGAEVTAISERSFQQLKRQPATNTPTKVLYGPSRRPLQVTGCFRGTISHKDKSTIQTIYVVKELSKNLLGLPAITALNLAVRVDAVKEDDDIREKFAPVFRGLGNMGEEYQIKLKPDPQPHALFTSRNVPLPLRRRVQQELNRMESIGVISKVDKPTIWCAGMVAVPKTNGSIRICVDLRQLNQSILREVHPMPRVDDTLAQITNARFFTKLAAISGFWQIPLSSDSKLLTTFITPFGRYCFNKLPFGISSAPEHFQKRMSNILRGLEGVLCQTDDVLIFGKDIHEHDSRLTATLEKIQLAGVTLNPETCEFRKTRLKFLGHVIDRDGIRADPEKTSAIRNMDPPRNVSELRRFMGMVNQLGKFSKKLAELSQPLRALLSTKRSWHWDATQDQALENIKDELSKPTILALYDPDAVTKISADASSHGLGAVIMQKKRLEWKPIAYASRSMTETEKRYAQIEKEALASTWACEKFSNYILGKKFLIETDHKPLIPLLGTKHLDALPPRILRFHLRLGRYDYNITHVPGKLLYTADTLSRAPLQKTTEDIELQEEAKAMLEMVISNLPASKGKIAKYSTVQAADAECSKVINYCQNGWPNKHKVSSEVKPYWRVKGELNVHNNLLLYGRRIVIPKILRGDTLQRIHQGHQGIQSCKLRTKTSVWWPGITRQITEMVQQCRKCARESPPQREPLTLSGLPAFPWQRVATDLFCLHESTYLLVVDYFSRYPEVIKMRNTTSICIIEALKAIFSRHGIPETLVSDNGPQYSSHEFVEFSKSYGFDHVTSSPRYPQNNGHAERAVQTMKKLLKETDDTYLALLSYRSTPLPWCHITPSELLMGRRIRTSLPQTQEHLTPNWPYLKEFRRQDDAFKQRQKMDYDRRHRTRSLPSLPEKTTVWITSESQPISGTVNRPANTPRSYVTNTPNGQLRRNRMHLNVDPQNQERLRVTTPSPPRRIMTRSQTGTTVRPPERFGTTT